MPPVGRLALTELYCIGRYIPIAGSTIIHQIIVNWYQTGSSIENKDKKWTVPIPDQAANNYADVARIRQVMAYVDASLDVAQRTLLTSYQPAGGDKGWEDRLAKTAVEVIQNVSANIGRDESTYLHCSLKTMSWNFTAFDRRIGKIKAEVIKSSTPWWLAVDPKSL